MKQCRVSPDSTCNQNGEQDSSTGLTTLCDALKATGQRAHLEVDALQDKRQVGAVAQLDVAHRDCSLGRPLCAVWVAGQVGLCLWRLLQAGRQLSHHHHHSQHTSLLWDHPKHDRRRCFVGLHSYKQYTMPQAK